ncbi:MAG: hypothetical protein HY897_09555, partial [Deltaproteobacteria bacterium]|nr:hypothetical protein [Deltaproteobacteria bacterium]
MKTVTTIALFLLLLPACGDDDNGAADGGAPDAGTGDDGAADTGADSGGDAGAGDDRIRVGSGEFRVAIDPATAELTVTRGDAPLVRIAAGGIQLGTVARIEDDVSYDPLPLVRGDPGYTPPLGLRWVEVKSSAVAETSSTRAVLALTFERGIPAVLTVEESADGSFR